MRLVLAHFGLCMAQRTARGQLFAVLDAESDNVLGLKQAHDLLEDKVRPASSISKHRI